MWATTGQKIDAQAATLLADTGPLAAGIFSTVFLIYTDTSDVMFSINRMNALNSAVVQQHQFSGFGYVFLLTVPITLLLNERLTITVERAMIGKCQGSIFI